ncbi:hypothetical protein [Desulfovibrio sp. JC010]|uniref:hypothetical protein n=1 Tax=Desulfovibrio sp. JC010 TaxID=2593641 RepID=UPI0013D8780E|nr:hypothetical protein [Desulfovibrio sp. JC010]NDV27838.1 hypothetical protein [Desulfovibrio sp. JC010]
MFFRTFLAFASISCLVGLMFLNTGCSAIAYYDYEPENPYEDLPKSSIPEVMGFGAMLSGQS